MILMNLFAGQQWKCGHKEQIYGHSRGRRKGGTNSESSIDYIHYYVK